MTGQEALWEDSVAKEQKSRCSCVGDDCDLEIGEQEKESEQVTGEQEEGSEWVTGE
jgi:hypothetical protein